VWFHTPHADVVRGRGRTGGCSRGYQKSTHRVSAEASATQRTMSNTPPARQPESVTGVTGLADNPVAPLNIVHSEKLALHLRVGLTCSLLAEGLQRRYRVPLPAHVRRRRPPLSGVSCVRAFACWVVGGRGSSVTFFGSRRWRGKGSKKVTERDPNFGSDQSSCAATGAGSPKKVTDETGGLSGLWEKVTDWGVLGLLLRKR
jgi:hypothetical protein